MDLTQKLTHILGLDLKKDFTSVSYAIMKDGQIWAADSLGTAGKDRGPATTQHTYNVCSISKMYCTAAVMKLVEQGKVSLDEPIVHYLPQFTMADPRYTQITLRHCLSHTSGLPGTQWKHFSSTHVDGLDNEDYYQEVYRHLSKSRLKADPGAYAVYCNDGFTLAEMVVAKMSGVPFGQFVKEQITEPIGAHSTRPSTVHNADYPLVSEGAKPQEFFYLQGCGGFTTTMTDLCRFGQLFLEENPILSEQSKAEMRTPQGRTFLPDDARSTSFGLGWDNVHVNHPDYDLGEQVQMKSGNSFQFTSMFYVIPKYNAVLAISETHDCGLDVSEAILRLFAVAMLEKEGRCIFTKGSPVPKQLAETFGGTYLLPGSVWNTHFFGPWLTITQDDTRGHHTAQHSNLVYDGTDFVDKEGNRYFFRIHGDDQYFFATRQHCPTPIAMKARTYPAVSPAWEARVGKRYLAVDIPVNDLVGNEIMTAFQLAKLPNTPGVLVASFSGIPDGDVYGLFEGSFTPVDDHSGTGFLQTPSNGSRDLLDLWFYTEGGVEYCDTASYTYREESSLPVYEGQTFENGCYNGERNSIYRIQSELTQLPQVPEGCRLLVLDREMSVCYDSQTPKDYRPVKEGFLSFLVK